MRVAVIGAGPAGLTAALSLARGGADVEVFESRSRVGGLSRSIDLWGHRVDIGPHRFFSADRRINEFWLGVVGDQYRMVDRLTRVYFGGQLIDYPIRPLSAMSQLGLVESFRCVLSYARQKILARSVSQDERSFESWITHRFGKRLFELFFQSYSEKLWGLPCNELCADFAAQRIRQFSLWEAAKNAFGGKGATKHKTLADRFAYPIGGTGTVYEKIAGQVREHGGKIHLDRPVHRIVVKEGRCVLHFEPSGEGVFDHVISTMPLSMLVESLQCDAKPVTDDVQQAVKQLTFRNTLLIYLHVDSDSLFEDQWLYIQTPEVEIGRVTNFRNWIPDICGASATTVLAVERWCNEGDAAWTDHDDVLIQACGDELRTIGLLKNHDVLGGHVMRIPRAYPVYRQGYRQHVDRIAGYLDQLGCITPIGRYGAFKYNNQDHSILMGILAAENLLHDGQHDLWGINSDFDAYQEKSSINESGLVVND